MKQRFKLNVQPYASLVLAESNSLDVDERGVINLSRKQIRYFAKASGLKSNSRRKQLKRARLVILEAFKSMQSKIKLVYL
jgi:hypothetical protein